MQQSKNTKKKSDVKLIARSFAKDLLREGFSQEDLITSATIMIDQAIQMQKAAAKPIRGAG